MDLINHRLKSTYVKHTDLVLGAWSVFGRTDHHVDVAALVRLVQMFSDGQNRSSSLSPTLYPERGEHAIHHLDITLQLHPEVWPGKLNSPWMKKKTSDLNVLLRGGKLPPKVTLAVKLLSKTGATSVIVKDVNNKPKLPLSVRPGSLRAVPRWDTSCAEDSGSLGGDI